MGGGGAQHVVAALANGWARQGRRVSVITFQPPSTDRFFLADAVERLVVGGAGHSVTVLQAISANVGRLLRLRSALRSCAPDVVIGMVGSTNILTVMAASCLGCRVVISERNDPRRQSLGGSWDLLRRWVYPRADLVIANSREALDSLRQYVTDSRLKWLPNPLREPAGNTVKSLEHPTILAVGRLHEQKGYDVLIRAFAAFSASNPGWRLAIAGEGGERDKLLALAQHLGVAEKLELPGYVDDPYSWYRAAQIFVQPSRYEGLPNTVLEAMSCGLPCIVTDAQKGVFDFLRNGESGIVVPVDSVEALTSEMSRLAKDKASCRRLGEEARTSVVRLQCDRVIDLWSEVIDGD